MNNKDLGYFDTFRSRIPAVFSGVRINNLLEVLNKLSIYLLSFQYHILKLLMPA
jgi:hypothetical protein